MGIRFRIKNPLTFRHGVHPHEYKDATNHLPVERMPFVEEYGLPLSQHVGAPSIPIVKIGQKVQRGELIAKPDGFISTALHASVTGTVETIERRLHPDGRILPFIVIRTDPFSSQRIFAHPLPSPNQLSREEVANLVQQAGIVGMGGATFPSHVNLRVPDGKKVRFVILNGCECEPYLTGDHRVMLEKPNTVINGLVFLMDILNGEKGYIGVEMNKPDAIETLKKAVGENSSIDIVPLKVKYPQGAKKILIDAILHQEMKAGTRSLDQGIVMNNVATAVSMMEYFETGLPMIERVITVNGPAVPQPKNLLVPIGTPIRAILEHCDCDVDGLREVVIGGAMMGKAQKSLDVPVIKGTSGILAFTSVPGGNREEMPCIHCGQCVSACGMFLNPTFLMELVKNEQVDELKDNHLLNCFECGSCSFVCPSNIPLTQMMLLGKAMIKKQERGL